MNKKYLITLGVLCGVLLIYGAKATEYGYDYLENGGTINNYYINSSDSSAFLNNTFIPYNEAIKNADLGVWNLTTDGVICDVNGCIGAGGSGSLNNTNIAYVNGSQVFVGKNNFTGDQTYIKDLFLPYNGLITADRFTLSGGPTIGKATGSNIPQNNRNSWIIESPNGLIITTNRSNYFYDGYAASIQNPDDQYAYLEIINSKGGADGAVFFGSENNTVTGENDFSLYNQGDGSFKVILDGATTLAFEILSDLTTRFFGNTNHMGNNITNFTYIELDYRHMPYLFQMDWWNATQPLPQGMYMMNGTNLTRSAHAACFAHFGLQFGNNSADDFRLPDLRGREVVYRNASSGAFLNVGQKGGEINHTQTVPETASHNHEYQYPSIALRSSGALSTGNPTIGTFPTPTTGTTGSSNPFNVLDPYIVAGGRLIRC